MGILQNDAIQLIAAAATSGTPAEVATKGKLFIENILENEKNNDCFRL